MPKGVLVVDDSRFTRIMVRQVVEEAGYDVVGEAENGSIAVERYRELKPDAVMMDITMPVMDGLQAARAIISDDPQAKLLMCTALDQKPLLMQAAKIGVTDFIVKPLVPERIIQGLHKAIGPP